MSATFAGEHSRRAAAEQIGLGFPSWLITWGVYSHQFVCFPKFDGGAVLSGRDLNELAARMRAAERTVTTMSNDQREPVIYQASAAPGDVMCVTRGCMAKAGVRLLVPAERSANGPETLDLCGLDFSRVREMVQRDGDGIEDTTGKLTEVCHEFPGWTVTATLGGRLYASDSQNITVSGWLVCQLRAEIRRAMGDANVWACRG